MTPDEAKYALIVKAGYGRYGGFIEDVIDQIYNDHEAQLKKRDEEIEMLQCRLYHAEGYIKDIHEPKDTK